VIAHDKTAPVFRLPTPEHGIEGLEGFDPETIVQEINALSKPVEPSWRRTSSRAMPARDPRVTHKTRTSNRSRGRSGHEFVVRVDDTGVPKEEM